MSKCASPNVDDLPEDESKGATPNDNHHIRYTLEQLLNLGDLPLSNRRPDCFDELPPSGGGIRIPWRRPAESVRQDDDKLSRLDKRRERVRKFQEIVLSPQRRSFNMGCHMPPPPPTTQPTTSLVPPFGRDRDGTRDRRIGSGRIVTRDVSWDYKPDTTESEGLSFRNGASFLRSERDVNVSRDEWLERKGTYSARLSAHEQTRSRGGSVRRNFREYDVEPEWFSSGPTSQFDTIELRGFEEILPSSIITESDLQTIPASPKAETPPSDSNNNAAEKETARSIDETHEFNFDEYLQLDADFLTDQCPDGGSRFSQWFQRRTPDCSMGEIANSRRSSIIDELENIMNESMSPDLLDGNSNEFFAPISPANDSEVSKSVMDFLHTARIGTSSQPRAPPKQLPTAHKILNVNEIEASMRECGVESKNRHTLIPTKEKIELDVFKKFVANMPNEQLVGGIDDKGKGRFAAARRATTNNYLDLVQKVIFHGSTQTNRQELLNTPEAREFLRGLVRGELSIHSLLRHLRMAMPGREQEIIVAVLWQFDKSSRAEVAAKLLQPPRSTASIMLPPPHSPQIAPPEPHIVFPPSTQTTSTSVQKLSVSPLPNANAVVNTGVGPSPIALHIPAIPQRIPSPRELQFHTQSIMQNALIRKKLEEQLENYRKRQEIALHTSQDGHVSPARRLKPQNQADPIPTPLAFTPTSVLRKMTADKDIETSQSKDTTMLINHMPQHQRHDVSICPDRTMVSSIVGVPPKGRAIVKGGQQMLYASSIEMQQIQQYQTQQRPRALPPPTGTFNNFAQQHFTQQQQQRHHRPRHQFETTLYNQQMTRPRLPTATDQRTVVNFKRDGNMSPTSNQLARWFSPELLAQASAGKLPSLGVGQALSLEEFERSMQHSSTTVHN
ncbi:eukaryotic translation initiation factor 4E transporter isoform X2 [Phlebotomus argentipes]|uniref:eukaryotic translation initiation factor 4E transporter isoform X2 n=1 Tax=Phlebotomus argentipes TaxID=94469 RepID=UPI0028936FC2|nr:eukaryotic translation initiation factor 4E transporter isoform X2 [Phlebotomus argentipes]